jgi:vitamin B12 transporter
LLGCGPALAQQAIELPGIVVQGGSIRVRPTAPAPAPAPATNTDTATAATAPATTTDAATAAPRDDTNADAPGGTQADTSGTAASVVTNADLRRLQARNGADALRALPGVSVSQQGGAQNLTVVRLRGAESRHTLVLIDGMEVNSGTDGIYDFSNLATDDIERIEVLRGPQSGLYGSKAIGGVINIVTRSGKGPLTLRAFTEAGSFGTVRAGAQMSGGTDRAHGSLTISGLASDGYNISTTGDEKESSRSRLLAFSGGVKLSDALKIDGTLRWSTTKVGFDDGFGGVSAEGFTIPADAPFQQETDVKLGRVQAVYDPLAGAWVSKLFGGITATDVDALQFSQTLSSSTTAKYGAASTVRLGGAGAAIRHFVTAQLDRQDEAFQQRVGATFGPRFERGTTGLSGEIRGEYFDTLTVTGTLRRDLNEVFDDTTTWRMAAAWRIAQSPFRLHASYGTAVRNPGFADLFGVFSGFRANPDLKAEASRGWDAGIEATVLNGRALLDVTYFDQNLTNEISSRFGFDAAGFFFQPFNKSDVSTRRGIEIAGRWKATPQLFLSAAYTYLVARETDEATGQRVQEVRRAPHTGRVDATYLFDSGKGSLTLGAAYTSTLTDLGFQAVPPFDTLRIPLDAVWLARAAAAYKVAPGIELFGRVENALDRKYQEVYGYNAPGLAAFAGVRITYEDPSTKDWERFR